MASIDMRLRTLRRAVQACRDMPGRSGRLVRLDADEVVVGGDMHGHLENFRRLMQRADLGRNPRRHLVVQELIHGPFRYPTGADKSHQLVDLVCALSAQYPRQVHYLIGNHELAQVTGRPVLKHEDDLNERFVEGVRLAYGEHADAVLELYMELFAELPFALCTAGRTWISHSLPSPRYLPSFDAQTLEREPTESDLAPGGSLYAIVWGRDTREQTLTDYLARVDADVLISGHIPCDQGYDLPTARQLILDSQGSPAACGMVPASRSLLGEGLAECVQLL